MALAASVYPPSFPYAGSGKTFLTETHPQFKACFKTSYQGFVREEASELPADLHTGFRDAVRPAAGSLCRRCRRHCPPPPASAAARASSRNPRR